MPDLLVECLGLHQHSALIHRALPSLPQVLLLECWSSGSSLQGRQLAAASPFPSVLLRLLWQLPQLPGHQSS